MMDGLKKTMAQKRLNLNQISFSYNIYINIITH